MIDREPISTCLPGRKGARIPGRWAAIVAILLVLALVPPLALAFDQPFLIRVFTRVILFAISAVALNLILGFGGLVSLLQAGFFGLGGYVVAILAHHEYNAEPLFGLFGGSSNLALSIPVAFVAVGVLAMLLGLVSLRTSGSYFIMITLAFNQMLYFFFVALEQYGGEDGLQVLSTLHFAGLNVTQRVLFYYVCLSALAATLALVTAIVVSRFGMILRAMAQNERRVIAVGIPPLRYKLAAFVIAAMLGGLAGALSTAGQQFVSPADMSWIRSGEFAIMAVLGGTAAVWGPVVGAAVFLVLELLLSNWTMFWQLPLGILIILAAATLHGGLAAAGGNLFRWARGGPHG